MQLVRTLRDPQVQSAGVLRNPQVHLVRAFRELHPQVQLARILRLTLKSSSLVSTYFNKFSSPIATTFKKS